MPEFDDWLEHLKDRRAAARIALRLVHVKSGTLGDMKAVGDGIHELRVHFGPGYRVYVLRAGELIVVCLCGGDKSSQGRDIMRAKVLANKWRSRG